MDWLVRKVWDPNTPGWVALPLTILLLVVVGVGGTSITLRRRKYALMSRRCRALNHEFKAAQAREHLTTNEEERIRLVKERDRIALRCGKAEDNIRSLAAKHEKVKATIEKAASWEDLDPG